MHPAVILVPVAAAGIGYGLWRLFYGGDETPEPMPEPEPMPGPVPAPEPKPAPKPDSTPRPPNASGDPLGYNSDLFHSPAAVCRVGHLLGYNFANKKPGDPGYGTPGVCDSIKANTDLAWKQFQADYDKVAASGKYLSDPYPVRGAISDLGYNKQRHTLNAMEIAMNQGRPWMSIVGEVK